MGISALNNPRNFINSPVNGSFSGKKQNVLNENRYDEVQKAKSDKISNMKKLIRGTERKQDRPASVVDSTLSYGEKIRESRNSSKNTASQLKKLKYNFKDISSQIRKAKSSVNAKQVASKARREVVQLKAKLQTGKYDDEELQAAIEHAKSMERAAKKKARHLEEEELIKITDKSNGEAEIASEIETEVEEQAEETIEEYKEELEESMEESIEEVSEEMMALMTEAMEDMVDDTLEELMDGMMVITDFEMTEDEFKEFKTKHRTSEDKDMLEADAKYLKAIFDMYEKRMGSGESINIGNGDVMPSANYDFGSVIPNVVDISL